MADSAAQAGHWTSAGQGVLFYPDKPVIERLPDKGFLV